MAKCDLINPKTGKFCPIQDGHSYYPEAQIKKMGLLTREQFAEKFPGRKIGG